eukprot:4327177-Prymnesium_polylepis.1
MATYSMRMLRGVFASTRTRAVPSPQGLSWRPLRAPLSPLRPPQPAACGSSPEPLPSLGRSNG